MNHRILLCLVLILGNLLVASADCIDLKPGDVEYDCTNNVEDTEPKDASEEKNDDIVENDPEYPDYNDNEELSENQESTSTTTTTTTTSEKPESDELEYDYDSGEHTDPETQQDETHNDDNEATEPTGSMQTDIEEKIQSTSSHTSLENEDDQHINLFYDAIKSTLISENYTNAYRYVKHPERVECMITEMRNSKVMDKISKESYIFKRGIEHEVKFEFRNVTTFMYDLEREIQDANFDCTQVGNTRIYILIFVALLAAVLLVLYIRRRR